MRRTVVDPLAAIIERRLQLEALDFSRPKDLRNRLRDLDPKVFQAKRRKTAMVTMAPVGVPAEVRVRDFVRRLGLAAAVGLPNV